MRKLLAFMLCASMAVSQLMAQTRTVTGKVTDEKGLPLAAVTVTVLTSDRKVVSTGVTDLNGAFSLPVSERSRSLQFTYIGLEEQLVPLSGKSAFTVTLRANARNLSEVVVVGYGTQRKADVTGSIATVKGAAIAETPIQSFEAGLAGRSAGVQITVPSGVANEPPVFRIRGTNSISLGSYPLIVVDGIATFTQDFTSGNASANPLASINPSDIETIDIAKDAAATAIYGSRAANGVVFITTKKGRAGRLKVSYDGWVGTNTAYGLPKLLNASQYIGFKSMAVANNQTLVGASAVTFNYAKDKNGNNVDTKWSDYIYRNGHSQSHNLNISGGNDATTYYFSTGYTTQQGIIKRNEFDRINMLFNIDSKVNNWVTIGAKGSYSNEKNLAAAASGSLPGEAFSIIGLGRIGLVLPSILPVYNNDGSYNINGATAGYANITGTTVSYYNPVPIIDLSRSNNEVNHIQSNAYIQVKPLSWITLKSIYSIDYLTIDNDIFSTPLTGDGYSTTGSVSDVYNKYKRWNWTNTAQFDYTFGTKHNVSLLVGNEQLRQTFAGYGINRQSLSDPAFSTIQSGYTINNSTGTANQIGENYLLSTFGRLTYNFNHKYYLTGTLRQDEYSGFGVKKGIFSGGSAGWEIAQEGFWKAAHLDNVFSSFKFRGSYGKVGNNGIPDYAPYSLYGSGLYGGAATLSFASGTVGNPQIQWETSLQTDVGFNFGILHDRISGQFAYFDNNINNLVLNVSQAPSTGLPTAPAQNVGKMYNKGVEITLNAAPIQTKDFSWNTSFNLTMTSNKVTSLAPGLTAIQTTSSGSETVNQTMKGFSEGYLWVIRTAGVDPSSGKRVFLHSAGQKVYFQFQPENSHPLIPQYQYSTTPDGGTKYVSPTGGTTITQAADAVMYKNTIPKYVGGWSNTFNYKAFTLDVLLTYQAGFYVYYGTNAGLHDQRFWNNSTDVLTDAWTAKDQVGKKYARPVFGDNVSNGSAMPMDINVFKGDFVKLRSVSLSYNLPRPMLEKVKVNGVRIYVSGQNLGIKTKYPGPDPEVSSNGNSSSGQGVDRNTIANARTITAGVNVTF